MEKSARREYQSSRAVNKLTDHACGSKRPVGLNVQLRIAVSDVSEPALVSIQLRELLGCLLGKACVGIDGGSLSRRYVPLTLVEEGSALEPLLK